MPSIPHLPPMPQQPTPVTDVLEALAAKFGTLETTVFRGETRVVVPEPKSFEVFQALKARGFDLLVDVSCVDYLEYKGAKHRYGLVYLLASTTTNQRLTIRVFVDDPEPSVRSVVPLWEGANWLEREVWDLFGIRFEGHPDPQGLPAAGPRRAALLPRAHARRRLTIHRQAEHRSTG